MQGLRQELRNAVERAPRAAMIRGVNVFPSLPLLLPPSRVSWMPPALSYGVGDREEAPVWRHGTALWWLYGKNKRWKST